MSFYATAQPVTAQAWLVADDNGNTLQGVHTTDVRSIASITKLMTSIVVLDSGQSLSETIPKKLYNRRFTRQELLNLAIIKSDNNAASTLCEYYPGGISRCVQAMNDRGQPESAIQTFVRSISTGNLHTFTNSSTVTSHSASQPGGVGNELRPTR